MSKARNFGTRPMTSPDWKNTQIRAVGGLHYIKGNTLPYFTLTCALLEMGRDVGGGAAHELILSVFPELAPLAAMHLATIDGVPMYADANGWYWLSGSVDHGFSQQFHGGNGSPQRSQEECLAIFAKLMRVSTAEAGGVLNKAKDLAIDENVKSARAWFTAWVESQKPRWKTEADKVIADLGLTVYGDPWVAA